MWRLGWCCLVCAGLADGQVITTVAGTDTVFPSSGLSALNAPLRDTAAVAVDGAGNIYIADTSDNIVVRVTPAGALAVVAGNGRKGFSGDGGSATAASLATPYGVAVDSAGSLYIADFDNNRVRRVAGGIITTVAGNGTSGSLGDGGPATSATLNEPVGVAVDSAGALYIGEYGGSRVRRVSDGTIITVAGNGKLGSSGDGGLATGASLNLVQDVAVDASGNLYIADSGNNRIRKVANGTISTAAGNGDDNFSGDGGPATGVTLAQPATPASIGETVVIYCTGLGAVTPSVKEGSPAPGVPPLSSTDNPVTVTIRGSPATVTFSGLTPGSVGLYQINAVVPAGIATGDAVPVVIEVAGQTSPPVTMAVK